MQNISENLKVNLLVNCRCLVLPSISRSESFGISLIEAASLKKPVITTDINSGNASIVINNYNGFIIKAKSTYDLVKKCNYMLVENFEAKIMGENNYHRFKAFFTLEKMVKKIVKIYQSI